MKKITDNKMRDNFLNNQNISNNIIVKKPSNNHSKTNKFISNNNIDNYSSSDEDKNETIDNKNNDSSFSLGIEEVPPPSPEDNYEHLQKNNYKKPNTSFYNNQNNDNIIRNKSDTNIFTKIINFLTEDKPLNRVFPKKILPLSNIKNLDLEINKNCLSANRATSGDIIVQKIMENKSNTSRDNEYNSEGRLKIPYIIGNNKGPLNNRNNNQFQTTKIIKIQTENKDEENPINKNFKKNNINYYSNNIFNKNKNTL
jgi:hypothetical protein